MTPQEAAKARAKETRRLLAAGKLKPVKPANPCTNCPKPE